MFTSQMLLASSGASGSGSQIQSVGTASLLTSGSTTKSGTSAWGGDATGLEVWAAVGMLNTNSATADPTITATLNGSSMTLVATSQDANDVDDYQCQVAFFKLAGVTGTSGTFAVTPAEGFFGNCGIVAFTSDITSSTIDALTGSRADGAQNLSSGNGWDVFIAHARNASAGTVVNYANTQSIDTATSEWMHFAYNNPAAGGLVSTNHVSGAFTRCYLALSME